MWEEQNAYLGCRKALIQGKENSISRRCRVCTTKVFGARLKKKKKHFCWPEEKDLPMRSAWDNSTQATNIDPVLSLPGLQPIICLIPSDFGERNSSGSSSIYCNTGTTEGHSKPPKPRPCTTAAQSPPRKPPTCLTSCLKRNNIPFKLSCCSLLSPLLGEGTLCGAVGVTNTTRLWLLQKTVEVPPYPGTTACHSPVWRGRSQNGKARKQRSGVTNTWKSETQQSSVTSHIHCLIIHPTIKQAGSQTNGYTEGHSVIARSCCENLYKVAMIQGQTWEGLCA